MTDGQHKQRAQSPSGEISPKRSREDGEATQGGELSSAERTEKEGEAAQGAGASRGTGAAATMQTDPPAEPRRVNISMDMQLLHCAVAECGRPLKPPIRKVTSLQLLMVNTFESLIRFILATAFMILLLRALVSFMALGKSHDFAALFSVRGRALVVQHQPRRWARGHCRCDRVVHASPDLDTFVGAARVACPFKEYGCATAVAYQAMADHRNACQYAPCPCPARARMPGSGEPLSLTVPRPRDGEHCVVAVEGDNGSLFLAFIRAHSTDTWCVSVLCVRANAETGPRYRCMLWAQGKAAPGSTECGGAFMVTEVPSCTDPRGTMPKVLLFLRGPFTELHLRIRIDEAVGPVQAPSALLMQS
ncbi:hypothetical protein EJB05_31828, partial [Eragrostis curvula]